jgi:hypothetical protein
MVKNLKTDRINGVADVELQKDELKNIVQSVNYMTDKVKKELLEKPKKIQLIGMLLSNHIRGSWHPTEKELELL